MSEDDDLVERLMRHLWDVFNDIPGAAPVVPLRVTPPANISKFEKLARAAITEVQRWRSIAEAPKDGTSFLAASGEWQTVCCWNKYRNDWCAVAPSYPSYAADERPTKWQPLPAPPR